ncbi:hypothetical protein [Legionella maceachernii]|uniref:hypothetical protein n=1 Tax=Legionella maceachernii TaxID=466 RepID=UPI00135CA0F9|nr:hypothetical protein [Legionella maceachernii]
MKRRTSLDGVTAKSRRSLAFARDDSCVVVLSEAKDLPESYSQGREVPRFARDEVVLSS